MLKIIGFVSKTYSGEAHLLVLVERSVYLYEKPLA